MEHTNKIIVGISVGDINGIGIEIILKTFEDGSITIEKGSITVNGVSLTVVNSKKDEFSVAIIPYTLAHTTFKNFKVGSRINLEFDVIGKYVARLTQLK